MRLTLLSVLLFARAATLGAQGERLFYYVDREDAYRSLIAHIGQITVLGPQSYTVDSLGTFFGGVDARVLKLANEHHVKVMPLFVNEGFNQPALHRLLGDEAAQRRSIDAMVAACRRHGYWGIQFDVENINELDRDRFTKWFTDAAAALHAAGFTISIAVVHRTDEAAGPTAYHRFLQESWRAFFSVFTLGMFVDLRLSEAGKAALYSTMFLVGLSMFYHSAIRVQLPWLDRLLVTPQVHRLHHAIKPEHHNRNFADVLPIFDIVFGTYQKPGREEFPSTGRSGFPGASLPAGSATRSAPRDWSLAAASEGRRRECSDCRFSAMNLINPTRRMKLIETLYLHACERPSREGDCQFQCLVSR